MTDDDALATLTRPPSASTQHSALRTQHFFTPRPWAVWLAERSGVVDAWLGGATVLDPTCGRGDLLLGLMAAAVRRGRSPAELPLGRLFGVEREAGIPARAGARLPRANSASNFRARTCTPPISSLTRRRCGPTCCSAIRRGPTSPTCRPARRTALKPLFVRYGLVAGSSPAVARRLAGGRGGPGRRQGDRRPPAARRGGGVFPAAVAADRRRCPRRLSAVPGRRTCRSPLRRCSISTASTVFPGVATRYGAVFVPPRRSRRAGRSRGGRPRVHGSRWAAPVDGPDGPLAVADSPAALDRLRHRPRIAVPPGARPRQGVNPCGASRVLFVRDVRPLDDDRAEAISAVVGRGRAAATVPVSAADRRPVRRRGRAAAALGAAAARPDDRPAADAGAGRRRVRNWRTTWSAAGRCWRIAAAGGCGGGSTAAGGGRCSASGRTASRRTG